MNNVIITESVEVPFETIEKISNKISAIRDNHGREPLFFYEDETGKVIDLNTGKEVITMACKKCAKAKAAPKKVAAKKPCKKCKK